MFSRIVYYFVNALPNPLYRRLPIRLLEILFWAGNEGAEEADRKNMLRVVE